MEILIPIIIFITLSVLTRNPRRAKAVVRKSVEYDRGHPFSCKYLEDK